MINDVTCFEMFHKRIPFLNIANVYVSNIEAICHILFKGV